jgi:hypothetical protein
MPEARRLEIVISGFLEADSMNALLTQLPTEVHEISNASRGAVNILVTMSETHPFPANQSETIMKVMEGLSGKIDKAAVVTSSAIIGLQTRRLNKDMHGLRIFDTREHAIEWLDSHE